MNLTVIFKFSLHEIRKPKRLSLDCKAIFHHFIHKYAYSPDEIPFIEVVRRKLIKWLAPNFNTPKDYWNELRSRGLLFSKNDRPNTNTKSKRSTKQIITMIPSQLRSIWAWFNLSLASRIMSLSRDITIWCRLLTAYLAIKTFFLVWVRKFEFNYNQEAFLILS